MAGIKTSKTYDILTFYTDYKNRITPENLIGLFQEIATVQSDELKLGQKYMSNEDLLWVLIKYDIEINRMPKYPEKIRLETYAMYTRKFYIYRKFEVYDEKNKLISSAYSAWSLVNKKTMSLQKIPSELMLAYGCSENTKDEKANFEGLKTVKNPDLSREFSIRYTDIDRNHHVNNTNYISWAVNTVPKDIVIDYNLEKISIIYRKEGKYGEEVIVDTRVSKKDKVICDHDIKTKTGDLLCQIKTKWNK
ncbi:MAG: thioesterase [Bacillota bacterium]|nr:thioesterase [Bacillota bacterium]